MNKKNFRLIVDYAYSSVPNNPWRLPNRYGVLLLEGDPNNPKIAKMLREDENRQNETRKAWKPNTGAISIYGELKQYENKEIIIAFHVPDDIVMMLGYKEEDNSSPVKATLREVYIEKANIHGGLYDQLFLKVEKPVYITMRGHGESESSIGEFFVKDETGELYTINFGEAVVAVWVGK